MENQGMMELENDDSNYYYHLDDESNTNLQFFHHTFKEALSIFKKNINFIAFSILSSIPFFCFILLFEIVRQRSFIDNVKFLKQPPYFYFRNDSKSITSLIYLVLLYLVPCHLVELFSTILTVHFASAIYNNTEEDLNTCISLKEMIKSSSKAKFKGPFITSLYVLLLSTATLIGLFWVLANYYILSESYLKRVVIVISYDSDSFYDVYTQNHFLGVAITLIHMAGFVILMVKYLEWSAGWNMSLVISILDDSSYGLDAFDRSAYYSKGVDNKRQGLILMLVFFIWGFVLRLPCMFAGCSSETLAGIGCMAVYSWLICMGTVLKSVVFFVYYFDCKERALEKKFDEEVGRKIKSSPELAAKM